MEKRKNWFEFNRNGSSQLARPRLTETLDTFFPNKAGNALDLGSGNGRDTRELLIRGWDVTAVDNDEPSIELMKRNCKQWAGSLKIVKSRFEDLYLPNDSYDLVNASFSLPFCHPDHFPMFWKIITDSLKPNGILSCELFGHNDSWARHPQHSQSMTFLDDKEVLEFVAGFNVEVVRESEVDGPSFTEANKHWHLFTLVCRKR